jgi:hypothetical protein
MTAIAWLMTAPLIPAQMPDILMSQPGNAAANRHEYDLEAQESRLMTVRDKSG